MGAIENIRQLDAAYHERCDSTILDSPQNATKPEKQGQCWWPGCTRGAVAMGLCKRHQDKHQHGTLLRIDRKAFPLDELLELYKDVVQFAEVAGIPTEQAVAWLIAEGLNSYERRVK